MGTRADFYVGSGKTAKWIGSVAWDGYEWEEDLDSPLMRALTEDEFVEAVSQIAKTREDFTSVNHGWPWPWKTSSRTDRVYWFENGGVHCDHFSERIWPDMSKIQDVTLGKRSGLIVGFDLD